MEGSARAGGTAEDRENQQGGDRNNKGRRVKQEQEELLKTERTNRKGDRNNKGWRVQQEQEELLKTGRTNRRGDRNSKGRRVQQEQEELLKTGRTNGGETETIRGGGSSKSRKNC